MVFTDRYPFEEMMGIVDIIAYDRDNNILWTREVGRNKIVTTGRQMMSRLLGGVPVFPTNIVTPTRTIAIAGVADLFIEYMQWGSGGHNPASPATALGVSPSDEALAVPLVTLAAKPFYAVNYPGTPPSDKTIEFVGRIDYAEANGESISEFGIFNRIISTIPANALMFAKKNLAPAIVKNSSFRLEFKHRTIT